MYATIAEWLEQSAAEKELLPGFAPCAFAEGYRSNAAAGPHSALVIDVDDCSTSGADALLSACERWRCVVYETPTSSEGNPRFRVIAALAEPLPPHAVPFARQAFARELGLAPETCGVNSASDPSRFFFLGRVDGTSARVCVAFHGAVWVPKDLPDADDATDAHLEPSEPTYSDTDIPDLSPLSEHFAPPGVNDDRHPVIRAIGGWLARKGYHPSAIADAVLQYVPTNQPQRRMREARDAALRHYAGQITPGWDALVSRFGEEVMAQAEAAVSDPWVDAWTARWRAREEAAQAPLPKEPGPALQRLGEASVADALAALPPWARAHVQACQEELRTPVDLNLANAIGAMACAVSGRLQVRIHDAYVAHTCLFVCAVADPGEVKSAAFHRALRPIHQWEAEATKADLERYESAKMTRSEWEERAKEMEKERKRGYGTDEAPPPSDDLLRLRLKLASPPPVPFRAVVGDITSEKLADMLAQHGRLVCLSSDAGKIFSVLGGQYSGGAADLSVWLEAYDGRSAPVDRMGREAERPRHECTTLSAVLSTQPSVLEAVTGNGAMTGQGFVHRFCWVVCDSIGQRWAPGERVTPVPEAVAAAWDTHIGAMLELPEGSEVRLSSEAEAIYIAWRDELEQAKTGVLGGVMRGWGGKHLERCTRLAAVLWAADGAAGAVSGEQMSRAIAIGRWLVPHAIRALGAELELVDRHTIACVRAAAERCGRPVTLRDFASRLPAAIRHDIRARDARLANLVTFGLLLQAGRSYTPA